MDTNEKNKSKQAHIEESSKKPRKYVAPERIPDTVDNVLDKLFRTTPEQIKNYQKQQEQDDQPASSS